MEEKTFEVDIRRLIQALLYKAWIIILAAAVTACGGYMYAKAQTPLYTAKASLYVNNYGVRTDASSPTKLSNSDLLTSQALVNTYLTFLTSNKVLDGVTEMLDNMYTNEQIKAMLGAEAINDTEVFSVTITCADPYEAKRIVDAIVDVAPDVIMDYIEGSSAKVVDYATVPIKRSFPSYTRSIAIGGVFGGFVATVIIALLFLFNSKISTEEDIVKLFSAPVIGQIPNFTLIERKGNSYTSRSSSRNQGKGKGGGV